jgi:hypothetical protein
LLKVHIMWFYLSLLPLLEARCPSTSSLHDRTTQSNCCHEKMLAQLRWISLLMWLKLIYCRWLRMH